MTLRQRHRSLYWAWKAMKQRCQNPRCRAYRNYGARGIGICDEWQRFEPFCEWALANGWAHGLDLDRADNDGPYSPENCRWVTRRENMNNRRCTRVITVNGVSRPSTVWADIAGVPRGTVKAWAIKHGTDYAAERIAEAMRDGYVEHDYSRNHVPIEIMCVEDGSIYPSIRAASRALEICSGKISAAVRTGHMAGGRHFVRTGNVIGGNAAA